MSSNVLNRPHHSYFVRIPDGKIGRAYHEDALIEDKVPVYLVDSNFNPLRDADGKQLKVLCFPKSLRIIGFIE